MESEDGSKKKMGLLALILMIVSSIYGIGNTAIGFYQMGYAGIIWYVLAALLFFIPAALMFAEYGSVLKDAHGGIYSWLEFAVGEKFAFTGTFIWLASWIIWLLTNTSMNFINFSEAFFGKDTTQNWHLFGLSSNATLGVLGVIFIFVVTFCAIRGFDKISKIASIGGIFVILCSAFVFLGSIVCIIMQHGHFAQPITASGFVKSPNPLFSSPLGMLSFIVYAIFSYGGMETMGGVTDKVKKPERTFPQAVIIAGLFMIIAYAVLMLFWGVTANWNHLLNHSNVDLGNVPYVLISNLGYTLAVHFGASLVVANEVGKWLVRIMGLVQLLAFTATFFVMVYSPLKSFIMGSPKRFWPKSITKLNDKKMPANAMLWQAGLISVVLLLISFGGSTAQGFYTILIDMMNVSTSVPYLFLIGAFPFFKKKMAGKTQSFEVYKSKKTTWIFTVIAWLTVLFGIIFSVIKPIFDHDIKTFIWTAIGPVFFGVLALVILYFDNKRNKNA